MLRCLEALAAQDMPEDRFEIIVVDDGSTESVPALVAAFGARQPDLRIRALPGHGRGPATARNVGWRAASGRVIAFIDDDAYPADERWLLEGIRPFTDEHVAGVAGVVHVPVDDPPTGSAMNAATRSGPVRAMASSSASPLHAGQNGGSPRQAHL